MKFSRRDLFKFAAGSTAGIMLTPVPWKLVRDAAVWTQNWSWVPTPPKGEVTTRFTTCLLCPAACGVRARCVGGQPVSLAGVANHPASRGALCPMGLSGHHLPMHPNRIWQTVQRTHGAYQPVAAGVVIDAVARAIKNAGSQEYVAILDERPGRTLSLLYRRFLSGLENGVYLTISSRDGATLDTIRRQEAGLAPLGLDLENTRTILSFGAPVLDGWGTPGRVMNLAKERLKIIQVETQQSRTALLAERWLPIRPGTEAALALGLGHVIIADGLFDRGAVLRSAADFREYSELVTRFTPEFVSGITGIAPETILETARELTVQTPSIAIGGCDPGGGPLGNEEEMAIAALNRLLGSVGRTGGIVPRREVPAPDWAKELGTQPVADIGSVPDHSIRVLVTTSATASGNAMPWALVEKKLAADSLVVALSSHRDIYARHADYIVSVPAYLECLRDVAPPFDAPVASFSLSVPLVTPPPGTIDPAAFIDRLAAASGAGPRPALPADFTSHLKQRVETIHKSGRGKVFHYASGESVALGELHSPGDLWKSLMEGACWLDSEMPAEPVRRFSFLGNSDDSLDRLRAAGEGRLGADDEFAAQYPLVLLVTGWRHAAGNCELSPAMTKLYQESGLRERANQAAINPETGAAYGLASGRRVMVQTRCGSCEVDLRFDDAVMPGVMEVAVGPEPGDFLGGRQSAMKKVLDICRLKRDNTWRMSRAKVWMV